jgi:uncharacterized membrane protein
MTQVIDHAIQIPVSTANMWALVSNPENNPRWQTDCQSISFLNSIRRGIGMRWRFRGSGNKEQVAEVTAWYEGLGFEYTLVDGTSYTSNKGRIRLQEVPEGTIVQWTFSYELGGVFAGLRNSLGTKRSLDNQIVESLRNLFRVAKEMYREADLKDAKSLMRDAPNVQERSSYKPRYPSVLEEGKPRPASATPSRELPKVVLPPTSSPDAVFQRPSIEEPPIAAEDTKPNPVLSKSVTPPPIEEVVVAPTTPSPDEQAVKSLQPVVEQWQASSPYNVDIEADTGGEIAVEPVEAPTIEAPKAPAPLASYVAPEPSREPLLPKIDPSTLDKRDTATISVFELFGIPRPSNTQEMAAVSIPAEKPKDETPVPPQEAPVPTPTPYTTEVLPSIEGVSYAVAETVTDAPTLASESNLPTSMTELIVADVFYDKPRVGLRRRLRQQLVKLRIAR